MALQNRVLPTGEIVSSEARGTLMGNRGGRIHNSDRELGKSRWRSKAWISCVLQFKGRKRDVMGASYTELFFLDEATALAAGHRPCYECRRADALAFKAAWAKGNVCPPQSAPEMDYRLHQERCAVTRKEADNLQELIGLPDGAMFKTGNAIWTVLDGAHFRWTEFGYTEKAKLTGTANVLTPPTILGALQGGYVAGHHPSIRSF